MTRRRRPRTAEERLIGAVGSIARGTAGGRVRNVRAATPLVRNTGSPPASRLHTYTRTGPIDSAVTGTVPLHNDTGVPLAVTSVRATVGAAPSGQPVIVDVRIDGASIFGTTFPQVAVGATVGSAVTPDAKVWTTGSALFIDVTQGDTDAADLHVVIAASV